MTYYIYILYSNSIDRFYVGFSSNPWMRLEQHLSNSTDKYTGKAKDWILKTVFEVSNSEGDAMKIERFIKKQKSRNLILLLCDSEFITPARTGRDLSLLLCAEFFIANGHIETCPALAGFLFI